MSKNPDNMDLDSSFGSIDDSREKEYMGLVLSNQKRIFSYIITMVPSRSDAEDILQDTMTIMWRRFNEFEPGSNFVAWGITIAKYRIMKYRRSRSASRLLLDDDIIELVDKHADDMLKNLDDRIDALNKCIKKLSSKDSRFLKMRYEQDLSFRKIASLVGLTTPAVFKVVSQVHCKLIRCIRRTLFMEGGV